MSDSPIEYSTLITERREGGVLIVKLNRPDRLNALNFEMFDELTDLCHLLEGDEAVRVVVLTGNGRAFCSGLDLDAVRDLPNMTAAQFLQGQKKWAGLVIAISELTTPVIAAVNGAAAGAGLSIALACSLRVASTDAKFNAAFVRVGLTGGDMGTSYLLPRIVGLGLANEILMTGRFVGAEEAERMGLVNRTVPPSELLSVTVELATAIAAHSPLAMRLTKQAILTNLGAGSLAQAVELENRNQAIAASTSDMREALDAFLAKRPPNFTLS